MPSTSYVDAAMGVSTIGARTDAAGVGVTDWSSDEARLINEVLTEGFLTTDAFVVQADSPASMDVIVGSGTSGADLYVVEGDDDGQHNYPVRLDSSGVTVTIDAADASNGRIDEVWLVVLDTTYDSSGLALPRIAYRKGDAGASPAAPGPDAAWKAAVKLATITVSAGVSSITAGNVTDNRSNAQLIDTLQGPESGLDADTVDGVQAAALAKLAGATFTGQVEGTDVGFDPVVATDTHNNGAAPSAWPGGLALMVVSAASFWPTSSGLVVSVNRGATSGRAVQWFFVRGTSRVYVRTSVNGSDSWNNWQLVTTQGDFSTWPVMEVDNSTEVASSVSLTGSYTTVASVTIPIPSDWTTWKCFTHATYCLITTGGATDTVNTKAVIDGTDQQPQAGVRVVPSERSSNAIGAHRTGMSTTGSRTVSLQMQAAIPDTTVDDIFLYARAVRTS